MASKEREQQAIKKINDLDSWFQDQPLPPGPLKIAHGITIINTNTFVETNRLRLRSGNIYSKVLQASYIHLMDLKNYLEKIKPEGHAKSKRKRSNGNKAA